MLIALAVSLVVGVFDGIGLALFLPLIKLISSGNISADDNSDFISHIIIDRLGITPNLINIFLLILLFFSLKGIAKFFETYLRVIYQQFFMRKIRINNIELLNDFDYQEFTEANSGKIQNTFSAEVNRVNTAYRFYFKAFQMGVLVLVYLILAMGIDWKFSLLVILGGISLSAVFKILYRRTKYFSKVYTEKAHVFQNLLIQNVHLFKYLKATGLNHNYAYKLKDNIGQMEEVQKKIGFTDAILGALREPLTILIVFGAIFLNNFLFNELLASVFLSLLLLYRAITFYIGMTEHWNLFLGFSGSLDNMKKFSQELKRGREFNGGENFENFKSALSLKNIYFKYKKSDSHALKNIDLNIEKNETLAIVGESGSGKTTLMNLLSGLLKPSLGDYLIDNTSVQELDLLSFRKRLGYIVQDATIFNDTIFNNVTFWAPKTKENLDRFSKAVQEAAIADFISQQPGKEDCILGVNGINISGGQKQRLSIARELYKDVDFLFMDEATSALDAETEAAIQQNIGKLKGKYTILIIAHRLSTIKNADKIILMKDGEIKARGSFTELLESSPEFQEMIKHQNFKQEYSK